MNDDFLWVEKYRPQKIDDCILPKSLLDTFKQTLASGELPNMLFTGTAGLGKTTVAKALCNQLDLDYILINGSEEGNIDTLRNKIKQFASSVSLTGGYKVVILDEADYLNAQSFQPALRGFIEEFSSNCRFILTCNFKNRVIEPLHSRCGVYEFNTSKKDMQVLCGQMLNRVKFILKEEGMPVGGPTLQGIAELIMRHAPDWRRVLNELQRATSSGSLDTTSLTKTNTSYDSLYKSLKDKDFVFVGMAVKGGVAAGFDLELPHGEVGSSVRIRDQLPHGTALCTFHLDFVFFDRFVTDDFHWDPWFPGKHDRNRVKPDSLKLGELESHCKHSDACMLNFAI